MNKVIDSVRDAIAQLDEMVYLHYGLENAHVYLSFALGNAVIISWAMAAKIVLS